MTDRYVDGTATTSEKLANLNITKFGTLKVREGYRWYLESNVSNYAQARGTAYMGSLKLPDSDNIIISQNEDFFVMNDEIEYDFSAISSVQVDSSKLLGNATAPFKQAIINPEHETTGSCSNGSSTSYAACLLAGEEWTPDSALQDYLAAGKVPVEYAAGLQYTGHSYLIKNSDDSVTRSNGVNNEFWPIAHYLGTKRATIETSAAISGGNLVIAALENDGETPDAAEDVFATTPTTDKIHRIRIKSSTLSTARSHGGTTSFYVVSVPAADKIIISDKAHTNASIIGTAFNAGGTGTSLANGEIGTDDYASFTVGQHIRITANTSTYDTVRSVGAATSFYVKSIVDATVDHIVVSTTKVDGVVGAAADLSASGHVVGDKIFNAIDLTLPDMEINDGGGLQDTILDYYDWAWAQFSAEEYFAPYCSINPETHTTSGACEDADGKWIEPLPLNLGEFGVNLQAGDRVFNATVSDLINPGYLYVDDVAVYDVGDELNITNSTNSIIKTDGTDGSFFVTAISTLYSRIKLSNVASRMIDVVVASGTALGSGVVGVTNAELFVTDHMDTVQATSGDATTAGQTRTAGWLTVDDSSRFTYGQVVNISNADNDEIRAHGEDENMAFYVVYIDETPGDNKIQLAISYDGTEYGAGANLENLPVTTGDMDTVITGDKIYKKGTINSSGVASTPQPINITNDDNDAIRDWDGGGDGLESTFYVINKDTVNNTITLSTTATGVAVTAASSLIAVDDKIYPVTSPATIGTTSDFGEELIGGPLTLSGLDPLLADGDNIYSQGGATTRRASYGYIVDDEDTIVLKSAHTMIAGQEIYFKQVSSKGIGVSEDRGYYFRPIAGSTVSGTIHGTKADAEANLNIIPLTPTNFHGEVLLVKKATATEIVPAKGIAYSLLKRSTLGASQHVHFTEWQDQALVSSEATSTTDFSRPGRVFYGSAPIITLGVTDDTEDAVFNAKAHGLLDGDAVEYITIFGATPSGLTDNTTYYIRDVDVIDTATAIGEVDGDIPVADSSRFSDDDAINITNSDNSIVRESAADNAVFYVLSKDVGGANTIRVSASLLGPALPVNTIVASGDKIYANGDINTTTGAVIGGDTFRLSAAIGGAAITGITAGGGEINQFTPVDRSWKGHSLGLPKPCIHTDGSVVDTNMAVSSGAGDDKTYMYACVYKYIYNSNGVEYTTYGPVRKLNGSGVAYKYETDAALPYDGLVATVGAAGGATDGTIAIAIGEEDNFEIDDEIKIKDDDDDAFRNPSTSLYVITKASGVLTVSASPGGAFLNLDSPALGIVEDDKIYKVNGIADDFSVRVNPVITVPYLKEPATGIYSDVQWDLDRIMIELYRTKENGATYYYVGEIPNIKGETSEDITDTKSDAQISVEKELYTTGGGADFHPAPPCKFVLSARDTAYFCNVTEEVESSSGGKMFTYQKPSRVYQSIPGISGSIGDTFYVDLDDDIVGIGEVNGLPIVFTETYIYRLEGVIDLLGSGDMRARVIDENIGCASHRGIVKTPRGLFFAGKHGFYQTDGYKVVNITENLDDSFRNITRTNTIRSLINGTYDEKEGRVFWGVCSGSGVTTPDQLWVLWTRSMGFTTIEGGDIEAASLLVRDTDLFRGDKYGSLLKHSYDYSHDTKKLIGEGNLPISVYQWNKVPIMFTYKSNAMSFGLPSKRKWVNESTFSLESKGNVCVLPGSSNDASAILSDMKEIRRVSSLTWDDPDFVWGDENLTWNAPDVVTGVRRFPRKEQRCRRKQVNLEPAKFTKYKSDNWYNAFIVDDELEGTTKVKAVAYKWPEELNEADICFPGYFETDGTGAYTGKFVYSATGTETKCIAIDERTSDTEIKFFPLSLDGYQNTSAGQYLSVDNEDVGGMLQVAGLWGFDGSQLAGSRETKLIGLTKDFTISFWVRANSNIDNTSVKNTLFKLWNYTYDAYDSWSMTCSYNRMQTSFIYDVVHDDADQDAYKVGEDGTDTFYFDKWDDASTTFPHRLVSDGETWNHVVLTHKAAPREGDRQKRGAAAFVATELASVESNSTDGGVINVDDASSFTVGQPINIVSTDGAVTRIHTDISSAVYGPGTAEYPNRPHLFYVQAKDSVSTPNTLTLAKSGRYRGNIVENSIFSAVQGETDGQTGVVHLASYNTFGIGEEISFVRNNVNGDSPASTRITFWDHSDPDNPDESVSGSITSLFVKAKDLGTSGQCRYTLSYTRGGPAADLRGRYDAGEEQYLETLDTILSTDSSFNTKRCHVYLASEVNSSGPLSIAAADLSDDGSGAPVIRAGDKIYAQNSAHEVGGLFIGEATPGFTTYVNGVLQSTIDPALGDGEGRYAQDIPGTIEWSRDLAASPKTQNVSFMGTIQTTEQTSSSTYSQNGHTDINNITLWDKHMIVGDIEDLYNSGLTVDSSSDANCQGQFTFDDLSEGSLADNDLIENTGQDINIIGRVHQNPTDDVINKKMDLNIRSNSLKWTIRKHQLDQNVEIKEIDVKFGIMDNVEGRYGKEIEKSNA